MAQYKDNGYRGYTDCNAHSIFNPWILMQGQTDQLTATMLLKVN